jgi:hypothetical protein
MDLENHCKNTIHKLGEPYKEIHLWIDAFVRVYSQTFYGYETTTFEHRKHRHHKEGIEEAIIEFKDKYPEDIIRKVCEIHIRDDYNNYLPCKKDFDNPDFLRKYHE